MKNFVNSRNIFSSISGGHGGHDGFTFGNEKIQGISNRETSPYEPVSFCQKIRVPVKPTDHRPTTDLGHRPKC